MTSAGHRIAAAAAAASVAFAAWLVLGRPSPLPDRAIAPTAPLSIVIGGVASPLRDAEPVVVARGMVAIASMSSRGRGRYDLRLELRDETGRPVENVRIDATVEMPSMGHAGRTSTGVAAGTGAYMVPIDVDMPGDWTISISVTSQVTTGTIRFLLEELP